MIRRLALASTVALLATLGLAAPALAHIDPDPVEAQAGATLTVAFTVEHGCDGSPTVEINMRLPEGVTEPVPVPVAGWDERIEDGVVTYAGGPLPADTPGTFEITMTLPATPDTTIYFPFVQRCEVGEIRWIALPDDSGDEPDEPAPALDLIGPAISPPADSAVPSDSAAGGDDDASTTAPSVLDDDSADTTLPTVIAPADTASDDDADSTTGTIAFIISVIAVLIVGAIAVVAARRNRPGGGDTSGGSGGDVA